MHTNTPDYNLEHLRWCLQSSRLVMVAGSGVRRPQAMRVNIEQCKRGRRREWHHSTGWETKRTKVQKAGRTPAQLPASDCRNHVTSHLTLPVLRMALTLWGTASPQTVSQNKPVGWCLVTATRIQHTATCLHSLKCDSTPSQTPVCLPKDLSGVLHVKWLHWSQSSRIKRKMICTCEVIRYTKGSLTQNLF